MSRDCRSIYLDNGRTVIRHEPSGLVAIANVDGSYRSGVLAVYNGWDHGSSLEDFEDVADGFIDPKTGEWR